nr:synaptobrevin, longin-like domain protein [Tanacetum cinerariifolium]
DAYEKKLIQVLKIHTDDNIADLLTKAFGVSSKELASPKQMALALAIPEQTATGKEISNPFMAGSLPQTTLPTSSVSYALTASPTIRTSCIKQFWTTTKVKTINDEVQIQALIDKNRVNIKESFISCTLKLDDAEGISCLANAEIFDGLAKMGYEKLSEILTFYKAFFSPQWKFLIHTILQCLSAKTTFWNEFSSTMAAAIICLATNKKFNFSRYILLSLVKNTEAGVPCFIFPRLSLPSNDPLPGSQDSIKLKEFMDLCTHLSNKVLELKSEVIDIKSSSKERIEKLEGRVTKLEEENRIFKELHSVHSKADTAAPVNVDEEEPAEVEKVLEVVKAAKLMTEVVTTTGATTTAEAPKVSVPKRRRGLIIQDPKETTSTVVMHSKVQSKDKGIEEVNEEVTLPEKEVEVEAHKREGENIKNEVTKKQKIDEEAEDLKSHLQIIVNDDDDVYTEATPLASKIYVVDYKIHFERNKLYFKIIRADGNHIIFLSFSTMLKNFDREDLETVWKLIKERFKKIEPKNYSDDYLLKTLKIMFKQPDVEASVWRDQKGMYGLAKRYPLTHFTLEKMLNNVRLEVEKVSEMSLELLRGGLLGIMDFNILILLFILSAAAWNYCIITSITAQQTKHDLELVPKKNRLDIGKCNGRIPRGLKPKEETLQVVLDALALTPCYPAFVITADVPKESSLIIIKDLDLDSISNNEMQKQIKAI